MARVIGAIALSHSPFWDLEVPPPGAPGHRFATDAARLRDRVATLAIDAVVAFGPDHFRNFFYDVLPPFCIGVESLRAFGDFGRLEGDLPVAAPLAKAVAQAVCRAGFDPALSYRMGIDHGISQAYEFFFPERRPPLVPVMINANGAPRPSFARCHDFGQAVGHALRSAPQDMRVLLLGSGGMSHSVQEMSVEAGLPPALREYVIGGRTRATENSRARDERLRERMRQGVEGRVNADWDARMLEHFATGDAAALRALDDAAVEAEGGNGAHELRAWAAVLGAWGGRLPAVAYEAVPSWVTGMGCAASIEPDDRG